VEQPPALLEPKFVTYWSPIWLYGSVSKRIERRTGEVLPRGRRNIMEPVLRILEDVLYKYCKKPFQSGIKFVIFQYQSDIRQISDCRIMIPWKRFVTLHIQPNKPIHRPKI
jgi:hypothetical protein